MFKFRRKPPTLPQPSHRDEEVFTSFALEADAALRTSSLATLDSHVRSLNDDAFYSIILSFTQRMGLFSTRAVASRQMFMPWVDYKSAWGETYFHGLRSLLSLRSVAPGFNLETELKSSRQEVTAAYQLFGFLMSRAPQHFTLPQILILQERGLNPFTPERWPDLPESYLAESYRFDAQHCELLVTAHPEFHVLAGILAKEPRDGSLWAFTRSYAHDWNEKIRAGIKAEPGATTAHLGIFPDEEIESPQVMASFLNASFAKELDTMVGEAYSSYIPQTDAPECYREIRAILKLSPTPSRTPVTVSFEGDVVVVEVEVCREEFLQSKNFDMVKRIYLDRLAQGLGTLPHLHPSTRHVLDQLKRF